MSSQSETAGTDELAVAIGDFNIAIDRDAEVPIGVQLAWALRARIQAGRLRAGQRLPGLREVAEASGVNVNTVRSVYQRLDREGLIDSQQGSGTFVAPMRGGTSEATAIAANAAQEARETGIDPREVAAALYVSPESSGQAINAAAGQRRALRRQIAALEQALGEIEAAHPGVASPSEDTRRRVGGPALLSAAELEQVRTRLVRRLATVQAAIDEDARAALKREPSASSAASAARTSSKAKPDAAEATKGARRKRTTARPLPAGT